MLIVDLIKVESAPKERRVYNDPLAEAARLLSNLKRLPPMLPPAELLPLPQ